MGIKKKQLSEEDILKNNQETVDDILNEASEELEDVVNGSTIYAPPKSAISRLKSMNYKWDEKGFYCPLWDESTSSEDNAIGKYLKISRDVNGYNYSIGYFKDIEFITITERFNGTKPITVNHSDRNKLLGNSVKGHFAIKNRLSSIAIDLTNVDDFVQVTEEFKVYENLLKEEKEAEIESASNEIEAEIEARRHPKLSEEEKDTAEKVQADIRQYGFEPYLDSKLKYIHKGDNHKNIYRKVLGGYNVMRGFGSYVFETVAQSEGGKTFEDEVAFHKMIPSQYVFIRSKMTESSFKRYSQDSPNYFDRLIIYMGDKGNKKSFEQIEGVLDICKPLITGDIGGYSEDMSEKNKIGAYDRLSIHLEVESIGLSYSTVENSFTKDDDQLESRTIHSTPVEVDKSELIKHNFALKTKKSKQRKLKDNAELELLEFQKYLLNMVETDVEIINPYATTFVDYVEDSQTMIRDANQMDELFNAYCTLTNWNCVKIEDELIASKEQLEEFFNTIALDNNLIPYQYDFLKMLIGKGSKNTMKLIVNQEDEEDDPLTPYMNNVLEEMDDSQRSLDGAYSFADLNRQDLQVAIQKLLHMYRLGGRRNITHKENVFFRVVDVHTTYKKNNAYKNIKEISTLLNRLYNLGYLGKLPYKCPQTRQSIYYLTAKCEKVEEPFEVKDYHLSDALDFLNDDCKMNLGDDVTILSCKNSADIY